MRDIQPVHLRDTGPKVSNLHKGLLFLLINQPGISPNDRETLQHRLAPEVREEKFGDVTAELVGMWQYQFKNWPNYLPPLPRWLKAIVQNFPISAVTGRGSGDVDEGTAKALNWYLRKLSALSRKRKLGALSRKRA
jgi:hypothetical protein